MDNPCLPGLTRWLSQQHQAVVERVDTHISTVLLVDQHAYKLKKPLRLPFLDFSTTELRRHFCDEELRINQRTAADLYLEVLPVVGPQDAPKLGRPEQAAEAIDWVLHMRRFPAEGLFADLADRGALLNTHIDALAQHVATFHQALPVLPPTWRPVKDLDAWALESCEEIATHPDRPAWLTVERLAAFRSRLQDTLHQLSAWRKDRHTKGMVRECHGDLHLGNVVTWQGQVMAFDAIEFDADLRCVDMMNDAAFTFMDLHAHGLPAMAWRFMNAYVETTGDFDGLRGLMLFAGYRALVRAKVALLGNATPDVFARYWALAEQYLAPAGPTCLVMTMGLSGSGKSTLAQWLVESLAQRGVGTVRLRSDVERKRLHGLAPTARSAKPQALYSPAATERTYTHLRHTAQTLLTAGYWVVLDAASLQQPERDCLKAAADNAPASFVLVECVADPAQLRERIVARHQRNDDASDANLAVLERQLAESTKLPADWEAFHATITNDRSLPALREQVEQLAQRLTAASAR